VREDRDESGRGELRRQLGAVPPGTAARHERGRRAEELVAQALAGRGYEIVGRNIRVGSLEIDILARIGAVLAVVEVRTRGRGSWTSATASVTATKQRRVRDAASVLWASRFSKDPTLERVRFDVASVNLDATGEPEISYLEAAYV